MLEVDVKVFHQLTVSLYYLSKDVVFENISFFISAPCDSNPCLHSGQCSVVGAGFRCKCLPGYSGPLCESNNRPSNR